MSSARTRGRRSASVRLGLGSTLPSFPASRRSPVGASAPLPQHSALQWQPRRHNTAPTSGSPAGVPGRAHGCLLLLTPLARHCPARPCTPLPAGAPARARLNPKPCTPLPAGAPARARFIRHFTMLCIPPPSDAATKSILSAILNGWLQGFSPDLRALSGPLVAASVEAYNRQGGAGAEWEGPACHCSWGTCLRA